MAPALADSAVDAIALLSSTASGTPGDRTSSNPVYSPDGRYVYYISESRNLSSVDKNKVSDIYRKDLVTGKSVLVSTDAAGNPMTDRQGYGARDFAITPDGQHIAFKNAYDEIHPATSFYLQIVVKDLATGALVLASARADGTPAGRDADDPAISPDGTKVAFVSNDRNLAPGVATFGIVYMKTLATGEIQRMSANERDQDFGNCSGPAFSPDGTHLAFTCLGKSDLVPGSGSYQYRQIYLKSLETGAISVVSNNAAGQPGNRDSFDAVFSPDGGRIAFVSRARNLVGPPAARDTNSLDDIYVKDLATGAVTRVLGRGRYWQPNSHSMSPAFSPDGTKLAFASKWRGIDPGDDNRTWDVFVHTFATRDVVRVSVRPDGSGGPFESWAPAFSPDGGAVVFHSRSALDPSHPDGTIQVYRATLK